MQKRGGIRGDYFIDRLGGWTEVLLASTSLGIVLLRLRNSAISPHTGVTLVALHGTPWANISLAVLYGMEIVGAVGITRSKPGPMKLALVLFSFRVLAGLGYMGIIHGDKLVRSTLGFPIVVAIYCWVRVRALEREGVNG